MRTFKTTCPVGALAALFLLACMVGLAGAIEYNLTAEVIPNGGITMPDGNVVPAWGYALDVTQPAGNPAVGDGIPTVPGPLLTVPPGDNTLTIHLTNNLSEPTSLQILGRRLTNNAGPVWDTGDVGPRPNLTTRVMSFSHETPVAQVGTYTWDFTAPGISLGQAATNPAKQAQMGLFFTAIKNSAANEAYPGVAFDNELTVVFHDVDSVIHAAIDIGDYGFEGASVPSSVRLESDYFLINGKAYPETTDLAAIAGEATLIRFVNAGMVTHVIQMPGLYMTMVAEDGHAYPYPREQYGFEMPPAKRIDVLVSPDPGTYALYDARLKLSNKGTYQGTPASGGMLTHLVVAEATDLPIAVDDAYTTDEDTPLNVSAANGLLANDTDANGLPLATPTVVLPVSYSGTGTLLVNADGSFTYTPPLNFNGIDTFQYTANDGTQDSNVATVTISVQPVNDPPVATNDIGNTIQGQGTTIDVLANDTDVDGDALHVTNLSDPPNGTAVLNADQTVTYTPDPGFSGADSFTYTANDGTANSNVATVDVTVTANQSPVAAGDSYVTDEDTPLSVPAPGVLSNDTDNENDPLTAAKVTDPSHGTVTLNADGSFTYTPALNYFGADSFTYVANDGFSNSQEATVDITVNSVNDPPVANDDQVTTQFFEGFVAIVYVIGNDTDVDGTIIPNSVTITGSNNGFVFYNNNGIVGFFLGGPMGTFTYTVRDNDGATSNVATVTVTWGGP